MHTVTPICNTDYITKTGQRHLRQGQPNQDYLTWGQQGSLLGAFLADGMSDCPHSHTGAKVACESAKRLLLGKGDGILRLPGADAARMILDYVGDALAFQACRGGHCLSAYSSTLSGVLLDREAGKLLVMNLGDCLIGGFGQGRFQILAQPGDSTEGCCGTTTRHAASRMEVKTLDAAGMESVFLCTDGAWKQLFQGTRLKPEVLALVRQQNYGSLTRYLHSRPSADDCTFLSLKFTA